MRLLLARHGETVENAEGRFQGHEHGRLSRKGTRQTKLLARALENEQFAVFYASPLDRAAKTLEEIRKRHPHVRAVFLDELKEHGKGVLEGRLKRAAIAEDSRLMEKIESWNYAPEGGESMRQVRVRAKKALEKIRRHGRNETVLVVGHKALNSEIICGLLACNANFSQENACINEFIIHDGKVRVVRINDTAHLKHRGRKD